MTCSSFLNPVEAGSVFNVVASTTGRGDMLVMVIYDTCVEVLVLMG
jgi:hypothetical protein